MSANCTNAHHAVAPYGFGSLIRRLNAMLAVYRQRRALAQLDDRALRDIGISRYEADIESSRPAWDVPHYWMD